MTRKEVKNLLPILQAFAEGRVIQYRDNGVWKDITTEDGFFTENAFVNVNDYRIKPEPTYRPFANAEECMQEMLKHYPVGWIKNRKGSYNCITCVNKESDEECVSFSGDECDFEYLFENDKFYDGAPFGIKVEEE